MPVSFDDLIPKQRSLQEVQPQQGGVSFEDLKPSFTQRLGGAAPLVPSADENSFNVLPMRKTGPNPGQWEWDMSAGVIGTLLRALSSGGDVARGSVPTPYGGPGASATPSSDVLNRATEMSGVLASPSPSYVAGSRYGRPANVVPPPAKELVQTGQDQFGAMTRSGYEVPSANVESVARSTRSMLEPDYLAPPPGQPTGGAAPLTYGNLDRMMEPKYSSTSIAELKGHYDSLTKVISGSNPTDAKAAYAARAKVAEMIDNLSAHGGRPQPGVTPTMSMDEVGSTFRSAQGNYRSGMGANRITGELDDAVKSVLKEVELGANVTGPSYNVDRQLRNRAAAILKNDKNVGSLLPDEKQMMEEVANGTFLRNSLRNYGEMFSLSNPLRAPVSLALGSTGGAAAGGASAANMLTGGLLGGGAGAIALPLSGGAARMGGSYLTKEALMRAEEAMRRNSPLAASRIFTPPAIGRDMLMQQLYRGLLMSSPDQHKPTAYGPVI